MPLTAQPARSRSSAVRSCSCGSSRRTRPRRWASSRNSPVSPRARRPGWSRRSSARVSSSGIPSRGGAQPGPVLLRYARRATSGPTSSSSPVTHSSGWRALQRRNGEPRCRDACGRRDARSAGQPSHRRLDELGRSPRAPSRLGDRQGLSRRRRRPGARRGRSSRSDRGRSPIRGRAPPRPRAGSRPRLRRRPSTSWRPGLWSVAAPVRDAGGTVVAALSVSGPTVRLHDGLLDELGRLVRDEAATLSARIGYDDVKRGAA